MVVGRRIAMRGLLDNFVHSDFMYPCRAQSDKQYLRKSSERLAVGSIFLLPAREALRCSLCTATKHQVPLESLAMVDHVMRKQSSAPSPFA